MKAKVKNTGEVIELSENKISLLDYARGLYRCKTTGKKYHWKELEFLKEKLQKDIDWEQRRYEIAKSILPAVKDIKRYDDNGNLRKLNRNEAAYEAVKYADALIAELKEGGAK